MRRFLAIHCGYVRLTGEGEGEGEEVGGRGGGEGGGRTHWYEYVSRFLIRDIQQTQQEPLHVFVEVCM